MRVLLSGLLTIALTCHATAQDKTWPALPQAFSSFGAAVSDGHVYVYGGHVAKTHNYSVEAVTGNFRRLSLADPSKGWEELPAGPAAQGLTLVAHGGKIYRIGGMQPQNKLGEPTNNISLASCEVFDPQTKKWSALPDLPNPRSSHDAAVIGSKIYVAGGWWMKGKGMSSDWSDTMLVLDLSGTPLQWQSFKQPFQRRALNTAAHNGKLYVCCGLTADGGTERTVDIYDPATDKWSQAPEVPGPGKNGFSPAACSNGKHLLVSPADGKLYRLSDKGDSWVDAGQVEQPRIVHRIVPALDGMVLVLGGASKAGNIAATEAVKVRSQRATGAALPAGERTWAGFRGDGAGVTTARLPVEWTPKKNIAWTADLPGYGQSAPVVWHDYVFVTTVDGAEKDNYHLIAMATATGKQMWKKTFAASQKMKMSTMVSLAAPTPLVDADAVYAFFEGGDVVAVSHQGEVKWQRSLVKDYGAFENNHGLGSSIAGDEHGVFVLIDHRGPSYLLALDKKTGKNLWKSDRTSRSSWSSPVVARLGARTLVLASSGGTVDCYDADNGAQLCSLAEFEGNNIPSACAQGDLIVIGASEGRMTKDTTGPARSNCCLRVTDKDGKVSLERVWQADKVLTSMATPLIHRGLVYFVNKTGILTCLEAKSGRSCYSERLPESCWASAIAAGDRIWFFGKSGMTTVVKAGAVFEKLASNSLWEEAALANSAAGSAGENGTYSESGPVLYGVAAVEGRLLLRTGTKLVCIAGK